MLSTVILAWVGVTVGTPGVGVGVASGSGSSWPQPRTSSNAAIHVRTRASRRRSVETGPTVLVFTLHHLSTSVRC